MYELFSYLSGNRRTGSSETVRVLLVKCPTSALARPLAPLLLALKWKLLIVSRKLGRNERTASFATQNFTLQTTMVQQSQTPQVQKETKRYTMLLLL